MAKRKIVSPLFHGYKDLSHVDIGPRLSITTNTTLHQELHHTYLSTIRYEMLRTLRLHLALLFVLYRVACTCARAIHPDTQRCIYQSPNRYTQIHTNKQELTFLIFNTFILRKATKVNVNNNDEAPQTIQQLQHLISVLLTKKWHF